MTDLSSLSFKKIADDNPIDFQLKHPIDGTDLEHDGIPQRVSVYGMDSKAYRDIDEQESRKAVDLVKDSEVHAVDRVLSKKEADKRRIAACVNGGDLYASGKWISLSKENALEYLDEFDWLAEQCWKKMNDRRELLKDAKKK